MNIVEYTLALEGVTPVTLFVSDKILGVICDPSGSPGLGRHLHSCRVQLLVLRSNGMAHQDVKSFQVFETGDRVLRSKEYVGTVWHTQAGLLHVFEVEG